MQRKNVLFSLVSLRECLQDWVFWTSAKASVVSRPSSSSSLPISFSSILKTFSNGGWSFQRVQQCYKVAGVVGKVMPRMRHSLAFFVGLEVGSLTVSTQAHCQGGMETPVCPREKSPSLKHGGRTSVIPCEVSPGIETPRLPSLWWLGEQRRDRKLCCIWWLTLNPYMS